MQKVLSSSTLIFWLQAATLPITDTPSMSLAKLSNSFSDKFLFLLFSQIPKLAISSIMLFLWSSWRNKSHKCPVIWFGAFLFLKPKIGPSLVFHTSVKLRYRSLSFGGSFPCPHFLHPLRSLQIKSSRKGTDLSFVWSVESIWNIHWTTILQWQYLFTQYFFEWGTISGSVHSSFSPSQTLYVSLKFLI